MAVTTKTAHAARKMQAKVSRKQTRPLGNYQHSEHQWGVVHSINPGATPTLNLWLDGSQVTGNLDNLTVGVKHLSTYTPSAGDTVLVYRGAGRNRTSRVVLGKLQGTASPYPVPLGYLSAEGQHIVSPNAVWGGPGVPSASLGIPGDAYHRTDTPQTASQRLYIKETAGWVATSL